MNVTRDATLPVVVGVTVRHVCVTRDVFRLFLLTTLAIGAGTLCVRPDLTLPPFARHLPALPIIELDNG
ncbi:hypothetical protein A5721_18785 [Mycobacterium vulneris]|nr:hypothetical protein A5721_18785 [Mycolicibacterium vulneris]